MRISAPLIRVRQGPDGGRSPGSGSTSTRVGGIERIQMEHMDSIPREHVESTGAERARRQRVSTEIKYTFLSTPLVCRIVALLSLPRDG